MKIKGIALVELLIAAGIVAILALIAVPNFMESQARSKLGRLKSDMRRVGAACDAYRLDNHNRLFPVGRDCDRYFDYSQWGPMISAWWLYIYWDTGTNYGPVGERNPSNLGAWMTSPVAYLSAIPVDPFFSRMLRSYARNRWGAGVREAGFILYGPTGDCTSLMPWGPHPDVGYVLISCGPDLILDYTPSYDPTNGTVSRGDIVFIGKGLGFGNGN